MNLATIIDPHPSDAAALIASGRTVTYGELRRDVDALRAGLASLGIGDGDRVALVCANGVNFVQGYLALLGLGAVAVPLNPQNPPPALERELAHVGAKAVLIGRGAGASWADLDHGELPSLTVAVAVDELPDTVPWESLPAEPAVPVVEVEPDHLAVLMFTSGTAGHPQAAMLSHGNLLANIEQNLAGGTRQVPEDVVFGVLPLFHIFGLNVMLGIDAAGRCQRRARPALRPGDGPRHRPGARGHDRARSTSAVGGVVVAGDGRSRHASPTCASP